MAISVSEREPHSPGVASGSVVAFHSPYRGEAILLIKGDGGFVSEVHHQPPCLDAARLQLGFCVIEQGPRYASSAGFRIHSDRDQLGVSRANACNDVAGQLLPAPSDKEQLGAFAEIIDE